MLVREAGTLVSNVKTTQATLGMDCPTLKPPRFDWKTSDKYN